MLFVSFSMTPELPPSKPIVQATLYQLKSQSQATSQTNQKIAGEAKKTAAKQYEAEQMEQRKIEQQKQAAAKAAEQKKAEEARKAEAAKAAADKAAAAKKAEEAKKVEQQKQAEIAKKKAAEELAKKKAAAADNDDTPCVRCGKADDDEDDMLLCDGPGPDGKGCKQAMHCGCCEPPLSEPPEGDWLCPACVQATVPQPIKEPTQQLAPPC